jgi:hypothetical protein
VGLEGGALQTGIFGAVAGKSAFGNGQLKAAVLDRPDRASLVRSAFDLIAAIRD